MTDRPYTDDDLRALAATLHSRAAAKTDIAIRPAVESKWGDQLDDEAYDEASDQIVRILDRAADTSAWAVHLGADALKPSTEHEITIDAGRPIARIHFAFEPDMPEDMRTGLVEGVGFAIDRALEGGGEQTDEGEDSDGDVFELIGDIASKLRDATDSSEYHAFGLIYDLAMGRSTIADARAQLAELTFRHV
ncbi:hypothetical protein [Streptomyces sp. NPDC056512]|uniref:hypothetical protein n=1 Tax=Streptomyces sp. NPDC056512 TaxID=3345846 RepID=UPI0036AE3B0E